MRGREGWGRRIMAIFKKFKKQKEEQPQVKKAEKDFPKEAKENQKIKARKTEPAPKAKETRQTGLSRMALVSPHVTEKATLLGANNQYVFRVDRGANKPEIKKAVESVYNVNVEDVKIINVRPKQRRLGRIKGWKKGYKKSIVTLRKGQEIELLPR